MAIHNYVLGIAKVPPRFPSHPPHPQSIRVYRWYQVASANFRVVTSTVCKFPPPKPTQKRTQERQPTPSNNQPTNQLTNNHQPNTKQRTQERHIKSCCVCVALVSAVWCAGGYWMSWRLAYDSPPIDNKQPATNQQPTNQQPTPKRTQERQPTTNSQPTKQPTTN